MNFREYLKENKFKTGWDVIEFLDSKPELKEYRNEDATYDDTYFEIPMNIVKKVLKWTEKDIERIDDKLENYEGSMDVYNNVLYVTGGA